MMTSRMLNDSKLDKPRPFAWILIAVATNNNY